MKKLEPKKSLKDIYPYKDYGYSYPEIRYVEPVLPYGWGTAATATTTSAASTGPEIPTLKAHWGSALTTVVESTRTIMVGQEMHERIASVILDMAQKDCLHETTTVCVESVEGEDGLTHKTQFLKCSRCGKIITDKITNKTI